MAYASGEKRNGSSSLGAPGPPGAASSPCPPSQPRKGTGSRPVLSARSSTSANGSQAASGPLVASVLGNGYTYHGRNASPGPQRNTASPQHGSSQRSTSASLQRSTSSSRQRSSHGQVPGKPFFAAYGLQYSSNGRSNSGIGNRASANMSPYRHRPSSSTGPTSTGVPAAMAAGAGRPSTSQAPQRASGENWFGNTKLSVTLPNEAARVVQELGQLLSVFAPPSPSGAPQGIKAPASFRANKYAGGGGAGSSTGSGSNPHKEAWGSGGGGSMDLSMSGSGGGPLLRPTSAASSTGSASKPVMAPFMGDGRHSHGQSANLSLMRLQQQQQQQQYQSQHQQQQQYQGIYGLQGSGSVLSTANSGPPPAPSAQYHHMSQSGGPSGAPGSYMQSSYMTYQSLNGSYQDQGSSGGGGGSAGGASGPPQPPRLNLSMVGGGSPVSSPKDSGSISPGASPGASPHGMPSASGYPPYAPYPHAPTGPPPARSWDAAHAPAPAPNGYAAVGNQYTNSATARTPVYMGSSGAAPPSQLLSPRPSGGSNSSTAASTYHYLPSVDGAASAPVTASGAATVGYTTMTVAASGTTSQPTYSQSSSFHAPSPSTHPGFSSTTPASASFNSAMAAAAAVALGTHPPPQPLPVPTSGGPVPQAPPSSLAPSPHSAPLHLAQQTAGTAAAAGGAAGPGFSLSPTMAPSGAAATAAAASYSPAAAKVMRDSLLATTSGNSSSGNVSSPSPSSSSSQVQQAPSASAFATGAAPGFGAAPSPSGAGAFPSALRSSSLANAPHPVGLPPPSPLKVAPPPSAPGSSRGTYIRSNSSRSSNGYDTVPYYGSALASVPDAEREEPGAGSVSSMGSAPQHGSQRDASTPPRPVYASSDGAFTSTPAGAQAGSSAFATTQLGGAAGSGNSISSGGGGGTHVTWAASVTATTTATAPPSATPSTPTRMQNYSYTDVTTRRISCSSTLGVDAGSPFARGADGHSRMLVEHGTLTCIRPSTVPSNFAADSQTDLGAYGAEPTTAGGSGGGGEGQASGGSGAYGAAAASTSPSPSSAAATMTAAQTWAPSSLAAATTYGQSTATGSAAGAVTTAQQPWRKSTDGLDQMMSGGATAAPAGTSSSSQQQRQQQQSTAAQQAAAGGATQPPPSPAAVAAAASTAGSSAYSTAQSYGTGRDEGAWGRTRDATPSRERMYGSTQSSSLQQQQQQVESQQTTAADAVAASAAAAAAAMAAASAAAAAVRQAVAAATEAHNAQGSSQRSGGSAGSGAQQATLSSASATGTAATGSHASSTSASAAAAAGSSSGGGAVPLPADQPLRPKATPSPVSPRYSPWTDAGSKPQSATPATPSTTGTAAAAAAAASGSGSSPPAASSPAGSSAAGSAVSSGSTSSGTVSSSYTAAGSSGGASAAGSGSSGLHTSALRRSGSIVARFNPASVLGSEPDPTFGNLLPGYSVGKVIGEGGFCQVRLAVHHLSQRKVAVKVIDRAKLVDPNEAKRMQREIRVMKHLSHQCVIKLFEVVESPRHLFLVMEHAPSGSLLDYVRSRKRLPEADACLFFQQIVASLEYCHSREVVHRDIKLENILLDVDQRMKLIDFGLSAFFVPGKRLRVHCGSPSYAAPEIVARKAYEGPPVDVWSLGVVLFAMVAGYLPFHASGGNKQELCNKIIAGQYTAPEWLSSSMKDLLARMLTTDPEKRITFPQVWQHSWVRNGPQWHERGVNCYEVAPDASAPGGLRCDEQVVAELEAAGFSRSTLVQHLAAGEATHLTASYFLLCESKADALRRMRGSSSSNPRGGRSSGSASTSVRSSSVSASMTNHGSAQLAAAVAKARTAESPGRGTGSGSSSSRPSTAMGAGGYPGSARAHRGGHQGEEVGAGRMAVAV